MQGSPRSSLSADQTLGVEPVEVHNRTLYKEVEDQQYAEGYPGGERILCQRPDPRRRILLALPGTFAERPIAHKSKPPRLVFNRAKRQRKGAQSFFLKLLDRQTQELPRPL
jgi:hypothetical protein